MSAPGTGPSRLGASLDPTELRAAEEEATVATRALLVEYVAYLEAEHDRILSDAADERQRLEDELNQARHQAHLLGALIQEMRNQRSYRAVQALARRATLARRLLGRARPNR